MKTAQHSSTFSALRSAVNRERLIDTAVRLIEIPSPTKSGAEVANRLAEILAADGFDVERPEAGWPAAPAVAVRFHSGSPGPTLQFNGHLDTVHLPFIPPHIENGVLYGSGSSDMKGGVAAMVEALRVLKENRLLSAGSILLTAHDLHEAPWGDGGQLDQLIDEGYVGDGVLIPEYLCESLPVVGRGLAVFKVQVSRDGIPVHEVLGGLDQPNVIAAGAEVIRRFGVLDRQLAQRKHPMAGRESLFVGRAAGGEIYNQSPTLFEIEGTRRWLPGVRADDARDEIDSILTQVANQTGTKIERTFQVVRDAFEIDRESTLVNAFQKAYVAATGNSLPIAAKPFVDDGNSFAARGKVPSITHGPNASGAHTVNEKVPIDELVRVAALYALVAIEFCSAGERPA